MRRGPRKLPRCIERVTQQQPFMRCLLGRKEACLWQCSNASSRPSWCSSPRRHAAADPVAASRRRTPFRHRLRPPLHPRRRRVRPHPRPLQRRRWCSTTTPASVTTTGITSSIRIRTTITPASVANVHLGWQASLSDYNTQTQPVLATEIAGHAGVLFVGGASGNVVRHTTRATGSLDCGSSNTRPSRPSPAAKPRTPRFGIGGTVSVRPGVAIALRRGQRQYRRIERARRRTTLYHLDGATGSRSSAKWHSYPPVDLGPTEPRLLAYGGDARAATVWPTSAPARRAISRRGAAGSRRSACPAMTLAGDVLHRDLEPRGHARPWGGGGVWGWGGVALDRRRQRVYRRWKCRRRHERPTA